MANKTTCLLKILFAGLLMLLAVLPGRAQQLLDKKISLTMQQVPVSRVLQEIGKQGGFYFSYNSHLLKEDSLVSVTVSNQRVQQVLHLLFRQQYQYTETGNYLIIQAATAVQANTSYVVSGFVKDSAGNAVPDASVFERNQLVSAITDEQGHFRLQLKNRYTAPLLNIGRVGYTDTSIHITPGTDQELHVVLYAQLTELHPLVVSANMNKNWLSQLLLSSRQRLQSLNLRNFFASKPFQVSLTPGLSTHGSLSTQVVNKFSLNALGGYTAGVNGFEAGGLFNINKKSARYIQMAGALNVVGGSLTGFQASSVHNLVEDTLRGVQVTGLLNKVNGQVSGVQIAPMCNYAAKLKGVQIGLINIVDTTGGYSIGLLNLVRGGYRKLSFFATDLLDAQIEFKTGTSQLYSTLLAGGNISGNTKISTIGWGLGHDFLFSNKLWLSTEVNYQLIRLTSFDNRLLQAKAYLNIKPFKKLSLFVGPNYNWYTNSDKPAEGYKSIVSAEDYRVALSRGQKAKKQWMGWQAGITLESFFAPASKSLQAARHSKDWRLGIGFSPGTSISIPSTGSLGGDISVQKDYPNNISAVFSAGFVHFKDTTTFNQHYTDIYAIPVKAGAKAFIGRHFYVGAEVGMGFAFHQKSNFFIWTSQVGTELGKSFDIALKYETYAQTGYPNLLAFRLGYNIQISRPAQ